MKESPLHTTITIKKQGRNKIFLEVGWSRTEQKKHRCFDNLAKEPNIRYSLYRFSRYFCQFSWHDEKGIVNPENEKNLAFTVLFSYRVIETKFIISQYVVN